MILALSGSDRYQEKYSNFLRIAFISLRKRACNFLTLNVFDETVTHNRFFKLQNKTKLYIKVKVQTKIRNKYKLKRINVVRCCFQDLSYKDKHWHEACFLCNRCRVSLVDKQFGSKVDKIYCGNCYDAQFASRCDGCGEIFRAGT